MTPPALESPRRLAIAAVPILGFLITPFLPFVNGPHLWFGVPSVLVWTAICVIGTVVALRIVEASYLRDGGARVDAADEADDPLHPTAGTTLGDGR
jgi:hypothetical protein